MSSSRPAANFTAEAVAAMKAAVGTRLEMLPHSRRITRELIQRFALAVGDDNPLWWDPAPAHGTPAVPPVALYACTQFGSWPNTNGSPVRKLFDRPLILWAGEHWRWRSDVRVDEAIETEARIFEVREVRKDERIESLAQVDRVSFHGEDGRLVAELDRKTRIFTRASRPARSVPERAVPRYAPEDLERFADQYESEVARRRGAAAHFCDEVRIGEQLGPMLKGPLTISSLVSFAIAWGGPLLPTNRMLSRWLRANPANSVSDPHTGIAQSGESAHWDAPVAKVLGLPDGYDFGPQRVAWVAHLLSDWHGDAGRLEDLQVEIRAPNHLGDVTWLRGEVLECDADGRVTCALRGHNQHGTETTRARAVVRLPKRPS